MIERRRNESGLDQLIRWSIANRFAVVVAALGLVAYAAWTANRMPVDVFPDLSAPTVTVVTEAHGMAPQEVESLVTMPIESTANGATSVRRVRSISGIGLSVVWVEFDWGTDIYRARQIVSEKLQLLSERLPAQASPPVMAPISSIMGEILFFGLVSDKHTPMQLRDTADWVVRKRVMAVSGVAQVLTIGGDLRQFQVLVDPQKLAKLALGLDQVEAAIRRGNTNSAGGFFVRGSQESIIRGVGRLRSLQDIAALPVAIRDGVAIRVDAVATVQIGAAVKRGDGSINGRPGVVLGVQKQPGENTLRLTRRIDAELSAIAKTLPEGMRFERDLLRQAAFIRTAVDNVSTALRDGAILVSLIILLFLWNWRATAISLVALPVSLSLAVIAMDILGMTINTMTLGGLTIAIGALVDDAIIDVENVVRRLRERRGQPVAERPGVDEVIFSASREIRGAIVFATLIIMLVFVPLFFLSGIEGKLLVPLGFAYLVALFASLVVAITLTPALCSFVLRGPRGIDHRESIVVRALKRAYAPALGFSLRRPWIVIGTATALLAGALASSASLGRTFLPKFNEGALTISVVTLPGTSLEESGRIATRVERILIDFPEVVSTGRRTGRAEQDEHTQQIYASEIEARLRPTKRSSRAFLAALRQRLNTVPANITIGQPITHRIDHMLSGTRSSIAVKVFGDDPVQLRKLAKDIRAVVAGVPGAVDVSIEQPADLPQLVVAFDRAKAARYGTSPGALAEILETAYAGKRVTQILQGQRTFDVVLKYHDRERSSLRAIEGTLLETPAGAKLPLSMLAEIQPDAAPNTIARENAQRKMVVMANVGDRDLGAVIDDIRARIGKQVTFPAGYYVVYGGQFESEQAAKRRILLLGALVICGIFLLLFLALRGIKLAFMIMVNLPLALIGGVVAVQLGGGVLSIGSLIGFITLFGIATRNGLILITHYQHLLDVERVPFAEAVTRGSMERLSPVLMTALSAALALVPLVLAGGQPGNEIQSPMGVVILGGLLTSTALNMLVVPALFSQFMAPRQLAPAPDRGIDEATSR